MLYRLLILLLFGVNYSKTLKCYSCGEGSTFLGQLNTNPPPCEDMERTENLEHFILECPEEYPSCVTQFTDRETKRTCDTLPVDDCETTNEITYCYCTKDLCNGKHSRLDILKALKENNYPDDDEDYMDMSGHKQLDNDDGDGNERYDEKKFILNKSFICSENIILLFNSLFIVIFLMNFLNFL